MSFLPKGYKTPATPSKYFTLEEGENLFRVLSPVTLGFEYWTDDGEKRKPNRTHLFEDLPEEIQKATDRSKQAKHFWAFVVLNRKNNEIQILKITQLTIQRQIEGLYESKSWGDPVDYDLVIIKSKTGSKDRDVKYVVRPEPKSELDEGIVSYYKDLNVDMEKMFSNQSPFAGDENPF